MLVKIMDCEGILWNKNYGVTDLLVIIYVHYATSTVYHKKSFAQNCSDADVILGEAAMPNMRRAN